MDLGGVGGGKGYVAIPVYQHQSRSIPSV